MIEQHVSIPVPSGSLHAFQVAPEGDGPFPGVLVLTEIFGLNDDMRRIARRFAAEGYAALVPDLYSTGSVRALCVARTIASMLRGDGPALRDLEAVVDHMKRSAPFDGARLAAAGFCLGGGFALLLPLRRELRATAPHYGFVPRTAEELRGVCPVVGGYGARDRIFAPGGRRLPRLLSELGVPHDVVNYPDAGHSYMSQHEPGPLITLGRVGPMAVEYDATAADDTWRRILAFFGEHVRGAGAG